LKSREKNAMILPIPVDRPAKRVRRKANSTAELSILISAPEKRCPDSYQQSQTVLSSISREQPDLASSTLKSNFMLIGNFEHSRRFNSPDPSRVSAVRLTDGLTEGLQRPDVPEDHPLSRREIPADFQQSLCNQRNRLAPLMGGIQHLVRRQLYTTDCT
jgi:hypothetical protein